MKNIVITVIAVVALLLGGFAVTHQSVAPAGKDGQSIVGPQGPQGPQGPEGKSIVGPQGPRGNTGASSVSTGPTLGAVSGPDISSPYQCINGLCTFYYRVPFAQATTTVCAIKSPNATTTIGSFTANFVTSSSTATNITLAKAATQYATTTLVGTLSIAANGSGTAIASTTPLLNTTNLVSPNTFLVTGMAGGGGGAFSPTGTCNATLISVQ